MATLKLSCSCRAVAASAYVNTNWRFTQTLQRRQQLQLQQQLCRRLSAAATAAPTKTATTTAMPKSYANVCDLFNSKRSKSCSLSSKSKLVSVPEARRFMLHCFKAVNVPQNQAEAQAYLLVAAHHYGHFSHGMNRMKMYIDEVRKGAIEGVPNSETDFARSMSSCASKLVAVAESRRFMIDCFKAVNVPQEHAEAQADLLVAADHRGHFSHGMNRLEMYINDLAINSTDGCAVPEILKQTPSTAWVDGRNGLGAVVGNFCMDLAIQKAKTVGVGWVCAKGSNHYGMAGWYAIRAMEQGLVGMSMTNTSPLMAPTRAKESALGTNPLSLGAPAANGDEFLLDMATTAVAVGKIEIQRRKGAPLPDGWAQDPDGNVTNDAELGFATGCLMPLGGSELTSGYKGYGLGAMVDILSGVMSGANYSTQVRKWTHAGADSAADLGQVFIAVDPNCFAPDFENRMSDFNARLRGTTPTDPSKPVLLAGDKERHNLEAVNKAGGIQYLENQLQTCANLAEKLKIEPLKFN